MNKLIRLFYIFFILLGSMRSFVVRAPMRKGVKANRIWRNACEPFYFLKNPSVSGLFCARFLEPPQSCFAKTVLVSTLCELPKIRTLCLGLARLFFSFFEWALSPKSAALFRDHRGNQTASAGWRWRGVPRHWSRGHGPPLAGRPALGRWC
jgi:hypothetical protein